jgi:heme exporter protein D
MEDKEKTLNKKQPLWLIQLLVSGLLALVLAFLLECDSFAEQARDWGKTYNSYNDFLGAELSFAFFMWLALFITFFGLARLGVLIAAVTSKSRAASIDENQ